jgi:outer membrane lipoprotein-sorting protein
MTRRWRWLVVALGVALLASLPAAIAALPTGRNAATARAMLTAIQDSASATYSGYAEASGGLALPVTSQFNSIADLFGGQSQLRVWWGGPRRWRVDTITAAGESDVHQDGDQLWTWDYQSQQATVQLLDTPAAVRLPEAGDLEPAGLARRLLSEATAAEVSRLPVRRIAGRNVPGLRLRPADRQSTIDSVDVWADPGTGVALRVEVLSAGQNVLSSQFLDFSSTAPTPQVIAFTPPDGPSQAQTARPDLIQFIDQLGNGQPPAQLAGLDRNVQLAADGTVGVYGRGVTEFAAIPLFGRTAFSLRRQLGTTLGVSTTSSGQSLSVGPLSLVLTPELPFATDPDGDIGTAWLLTGTVSLATLDTAATQLVGGAR